MPNLILYAIVLVAVSAVLAAAHPALAIGWAVFLAFAIAVIGLRSRR